MADLTLQHLAVGEGEASQMHCAMFTTSVLPVNRPEKLSTHRGLFPKHDSCFFVAFHFSGMRVFHLCKSERLAGVNPI